MKRITEQQARFQTGPAHVGNFYVISSAAPLNSRLNVVVQSPAPFGLNQNGPLNDSFLKIGRLSSSFSYLSLASLRLLILLLLLMSGNVHPNPGPIFSCSGCAGNVSWRGRSVQCCTCSKWVYVGCSLLSSEFRTLGSSHFWSCSSCFFWR